MFLQSPRVDLTEPRVDCIYLTFLFIALSLFSQGFGAGNFKSLFEAIEQDQAQRGNLY